MYKLHLVFNSFMMVTEVPVRGSYHIHIDLQSTLDWFLIDRDLHHERVDSLIFVDPSPNQLFRDLCQISPLILSKFKRIN